MGDFNDIRNRDIDQNKELSNRKQSLPLLRWLENSSLEDLFRKIHPYKKEFTWTNGLSSTRIDYIWASSILSQQVISCKSNEATCITGSDHSIVEAKIGTDITEKTRSLANSKRLKGKKRILNLKKVQKEDWDNYQVKLDKKLRKKLNLREGIELTEEKCKAKSIDEI